MAKKSVIKRNLKRQRLADLHRSKRQKIKDEALKPGLELFDKMILSSKLSQLPRDGSRSRVRNRCAISGRPRGNLRKFNLSRIALRELGLRGEIPGLIKSSW
jgi:small subunit ribosomal protein S14